MSGYFGRMMETWRQKGPDLVNQHVKIS